MAKKQNPSVPPARRQETTRSGASASTKVPARRIGGRATRGADATTTVAMPRAPEPLPVTVAAPDPARPAEEPRQASTRVHWVRQSCRLTTTEYGELTALKKRAAALARPAKRGALLRAGLYALRGMSDAQLFALLDSLPDPEARPA